MKKRTVFFTILIATILWVLFMLSIVSCLGAENKPVSQSTSYENKQRKLLFEACVRQTGSRSKCYNIYY